MNEWIGPLLKFKKGKHDPNTALPVSVIESYLIDKAKHNEISDNDP